MATVYEASEETKKIIEDWANSPVIPPSNVFGSQMPYEWFKKQPKEYQDSFTLTDRVRNTPVWEAAAQMRRHLRKSPSKCVTSPLPSGRRSEAAPIDIPEGDEHLYVVKIEGNTNLTGYGYSTSLGRRAIEHVKNAAKDGSEITQWNTFGFDLGVAKAVEKLLIRRFPLEDCTISGFQREATHLERYDEVVEFVDIVQGIIRTPIHLLQPEEVSALH